MPKAGIVTLHLYENFGSVLQAFALKAAVEKIDTYEAEIINYWPEGQECQYFFTEELKKNYVIKQRLFSQFRQEWLDLQGDPVRDIEGIDTSRYNVYLAGSDQIWNPQITHWNPAYFLNFIGEDFLKVIYAASLALTDKEIGRLEGKFKDQLESLEYISVREQVSAECLHKITGKRITTVLDPTMLLEAQDYEKLIPEKKLVNGKFILFYFLTHDTAAVDWANLMSLKFGYPIIHYFADMPEKVFNAGSGDFTFAGPGEFLWYIKNAELVFTNSFHGTVFSILFQKPFYTYTTKRDMLTRVLDLTERLGLTGRRLSNESSLKQVTLEIDYTEANKRLAQERKCSWEYLIHALKGNKTE